MIKIKEVVTKKEKLAFVNLPLKLYKDNKNYIPALYNDEITAFSKKNANAENCQSVFYLAYLNNKVVGRISGIIQHTYNQKVNEKRARFGRFDVINNQQVATALLKAVENWAKMNDMQYVHGPMGFNDLEREGLLIEGFDHTSTLATAYNYPYYQQLLENSGYIKEIDSLEFKINVPTHVNPQVKRISEKVMARHNLKIVKEKSVSKIIKQYGNKIFELLNEAYAPLYGVVPITDKVKEQLILQFKLIINSDFMSLITTKEDQLVGFGLVFPGVTNELRELKGKLLTFKPIKLYKLLRAVKKPKHIELALIAVKPEYRAKGVTAIILNSMIEKAIARKIEYAESNPELETNLHIQSIWSGFDHVNHKRRRFFIKNLN